MRNLIAASAALLGASMLAGTAMADGEAGICKRLERIQDRCERHRGGGSCDRIDEAVDQLCARDTIVASGSADSAALDLLRQDYEIVALEDAVFPYDHVVVGPADLDDPEVADLLREAHQAGKTVAITDATEDQVQSFHRLIFAGQAADCVSPDHPLPLRTIGLYGLQQSANPPRTGSYCLDSIDHRDPASDRRWLRERFGAQVPGQLTPVPLFDAGASRADLATDPTGVLARLVREWLGGRPAQAQTSSSSQQLTKLATGKTCSYTTQTDESVGSTQWDLQVWGVRSFASDTDFYLANFAPTLTPTVTDVTEYVLNSLTLMEVDGSDSDSIDLTRGLLIEASPQTDQSFVSQVTNESSTTVGGSVGFDGEALTGSVSASSTFGTSTNTTLPATTILNQENTTNLEPSWTFKPQGASTTSFEPVASWIWQLPKDAYPLGGTGNNQLSFTPGANLFSPTANSTFFATCNVTVPFTTWTVNAPVLTGVSPTSQAIGKTVTVDGQYLYNGLTKVLLGGTEVAAGNLSFSSPKSFILTVPGGTSIGDNVISASTMVSTTEGSQNLVSATDVTLNVTSD